MRAQRARVLQVLALLLHLLVPAPRGAAAVSYELQVTGTRGLPTSGAAAELTARTAVAGQPAYRIIARECVHGACATMGINSLAKARTPLFSSDGLPADAPFVLNLRVQQQTPDAEKHERVEIVATARKSVRRIADGAREVDDVRPVLHVSGARGGKCGAVGILHWMYHVEQVHVVEYLLTIAPKELRGCGKKTCTFRTAQNGGRVHAMPSQPVKVAGADEPVALEFTLRLHEDNAVGELASVDHYALAAHFADHAYHWSKQQTVNKSASTVVTGRPKEEETATVDMTPTTTNAQTGLTWSVPDPESREDSPTLYCPTYRHVATIRGGMAHVWYLSNKMGAKEVPQIVIAFHGSQPQSGKEDENVGNELFEKFKPSAGNELPYIGKVARQYNHDYKLVAGELREFLVPGSSVLVTGYSRSSGMATLAAVDLTLDDSARVGKLYGVTFGSPQVGDISFLRAFRQKVSRSPRFGFFKRIVAADGNSATVKVDPEILMPGGFNEYLSAYPSVKIIDCIRSFTDAAALPRAASGHLSHYVHVGSRVLLFENGRQKPPLAGTAAANKPTSLLSSTSDVYDFAQAMAPYPAASRMDIYVERLRSAQREQLARRILAGGQSLLGFSKLTLRKHVALLLKSLPWSATVRALSYGFDAKSSEDAMPMAQERVCSASNVYKQPLTVRLVLENPAALAGDERVSVFICEGKLNCHTMIAMSRDDQATSTVPEAHLMSSTYYATHRHYDLSKAALKVSILKQARSPNCRSSMSAAFPPEQVTTRIAKPVSIASDAESGQNDGPSGQLQLGDLKIAYVVMMPLGGDAAIAAAGPFGESSPMSSETIGGPSSVPDELDDTQEQIIEAVESPDEDEDAVAATTAAGEIVEKLSQPREETASSTKPDPPPPAPSPDAAILPSEPVLKPGGILDDQVIGLSRTSSANAADGDAVSARAGMRESRGGSLSEDKNATSLQDLQTREEQILRERSGAAPFKSNRSLQISKRPNRDDQKGRADDAMQHYATGENLASRPTHGQIEVTDSEVVGRSNRHLDSDINTRPFSNQQEARDSAYTQRQVRREQDNGNEQIGSDYGSQREPTSGKGFQPVDEATPLAEINSGSSQQPGIPTNKVSGGMPFRDVETRREWQPTANEPNYTPTIDTNVGNRYNFAEDAKRFPKTSDDRRRAATDLNREEHWSAQDEQRPASEVPTSDLGQTHKVPVLSPSDPQQKPVPQGTPTEPRKLQTSEAPGAVIEPQSRPARDAPVAPTEWGSVSGMPAASTGPQSASDTPVASTEPGLAPEAPVTPTEPEPAPVAPGAGVEPIIAPVAPGVGVEPGPSPVAPGAEVEPQPVLDAPAIGTEPQPTLDEPIEGAEQQPTPGAPVVEAETQLTPDAPAVPIDALQTPAPYPEPRQTPAPGAIPEIDIEVRSSEGKEGGDLKNASASGALRAHVIAKKDTGSHTSHYEMTGDKSYEHVQNAGTQVGSDAFKEPSESSSPMPEMGSYPSADSAVYHYEFGSDLRPMLSKSQGGDKGNNSPSLGDLQKATVNSSRSLQTQDSYNAPEPAHEEAVSTCSCMVATKIDCATPVPGTPGKCSLQFCLEPRCVDGGKLRCALKRGPQYVVSQTVDRESVGVEDEVECNYEPNGLIPIIAGQA